MANKPKSIPKDNKGKTYSKSKIDMRVVAFTEAYTNPKSPTFQNALQSGLKAGYSQEYSENITHLNPKWFQALQVDIDKLRTKLLLKAEKHFDEALEVPFDTEDKERLKIKHSTALHVSETLGKEAYSKRQELTGKAGRKLFASEQSETASIPLSKLFKVQD